MTYPGTTYVEYTGPLWDFHDPHPDLVGLLTARDTLVVLRNGAPPYRVVLGAPHQAGVGQEKICESRLDKNGKPKSREADENAASYALAAYSRLIDQGVPCKLVVMAHSTTHDPNKRLGTPYCQEVFAESFKLLFETHGAGDNRALDLELSAGSNLITDTVRFGRKLAEALSYQYSLGVQKEGGKNEALVLEVGGDERDGALQLPALSTHSLIEAGKRGIPALHLEARPLFRKPMDGKNTVTPAGSILGEAIANTILSLPHSLSQ